MVTVRELSSQIKSVLKEGGIEDYIFESRCITEYATGLQHKEMIANPDTPVSEPQHSVALEAAEKRTSGYPLQYITGRWEFFGMPFTVGDGVLIPRQDTETLVECVLNQFAGRENLVIADLCSGSGCIPVAIKKYLPSSRISAVEFSDKAMEYLKANTALNNSDIALFSLDVLNPESCSGFSDLDIITSNPPYLTDDDMKELQKEVTYEPEMALTGGHDGLLFYRNITSLWKHCLKPRGMIFYEIGMGQEKDVSEILVNNGFSDIKTWPDLCGIIRVVSGVYN